MTNFYEIHERKLEQFDKEARMAEAQVEIYKKRLLDNEAKLKEAEARPKEIEAKLRETEAQLKASEAQRQAAELRAEDAFQRFRAEEDERLATQTRLGDAEVENSGLRGELEDGRRERDLLQEKIEELEAWGKAETERVQKAMEGFHQSEEFQEELREENLEGFITGFRNCLVQAQQMCPETDLSGLRPRMIMADLTSEEQAVLPPTFDLTTETEAAPSRERGGGGTSEDAPVVVLESDEGDVRDDLPLNVVLEPRGDVPRD